MKYLRAIERGAVGEVDVCRRLYPPIDTYVANPYRLDGNITIRLAALRAHAIELARDFALQQMDEANELAATGQEDVAKRKRQRGARLLYKLAPGSCSKIGAIQAEDGTVVYDAGRMAKALQLHWAKVFEARGVDTNILDTWVAEDKSARIAEDATQQLMRFVVFARSHVKQALDRSNDSAPGPDGVPYKAWRLLGADSVDVLYEALTLMSTEDGPFLMKRNYPEFNSSLLHFLPKKPVDVIDGAEVYACDGVRPLNITNVDNRLVASAVKLAIEPLLNKLVTWDQRFF